METLYNIWTGSPPRLIEPLFHRDIAQKLAQVALGDFQGAYQRQSDGLGLALTLLITLHNDYAHSNV